MVFGDGERKDQGNNNVEDKKKNNDRKDEKSSRVKIVGEYVKERKDSHLVIAVLIATVTFTAGITMPGGYINEKGPDQGAAVLTRDKIFQAFVVFNSVAMLLSTGAVFLHLDLSRSADKSTEFLLWRRSLTLIRFALIAMMFAFSIGTYSVLRGTAVVPIALVIVDLIICTIIFSPPLLCTEEFSFLEFTDLFLGRALRTINRIEDIAYSALYGRNLDGF